MWQWESSVIRLHTRSKKYRSWVTIIRPPVNFRSRSSSQATISLSRWLVGSSRMSTSTGWVKSVIPNRVSMALASYSSRARVSGEKS